MKAKKTGWNEWTDASFWEMVNYHKNKITSDRRIPILWVVELILGVMIGASIAIYLDPEWNVVPFPWNVVAFLVLVGIAFMIHRRTRPFRIARKLHARKK